MREYTVLHVFCGSGGAAMGFQEAVEEFRGMVGRFRTLAGIDVDPEACQDFETLTGAPAIQMDLFTRKDYIAYHGQEPPMDWREATPEDIRAATGGIRLDAVFCSAPCQGNSGLLPEGAAETDKYKALNNLAYHGMWLVAEAWKDDPVPIYFFENVPRITTRSAHLLERIRRMLREHGYKFHPEKDKDGYHDCGELGGLGQRRKRYLMVARHPEKCEAFIFQPPRRPLKTIGDVIGPLPMPDDPAGGPMHRLPRLQKKTWERLALIPAGGDWRDLEKVDYQNLRLTHTPRPGVYQIAEWDKPCGTVIGSARVQGSNGVAAVADPRLPIRNGRHPAAYQVVKFDETGPCVTGARFGSGAPAIADPRTGFKSSTHHAIYRISRWEEAANTVTGAMRPNNGAISIADPRLNCNPRSGSYGVQAWDEPGKTVIGAGDIHAGAAAIADPRIPGDAERGVWVIIALDGTWHRPLTTYELAALQDFPLIMPDGRPLTLAGNSDARWRKRIGSAVPRGAAKAMVRVALRALMLSEMNSWELSNTEIWVKHWEYERYTETTDTTHAK